MIKRGDFVKLVKEYSWLGDTGDGIKNGYIKLGATHRVLDVVQDSWTPRPRYLLELRKGIPTWWVGYDCVELAGAEKVGRIPDWF